MNKTAIISFIATILLSFVVQTGYGMKLKQQPLDLDVVLEDTAVRQILPNTPVILGRWQGVAGDVIYKLSDRSGKVLKVKRKKGFAGCIIGVISQEQPFAQGEYTMIKNQQSYLKRVIFQRPSTTFNYDKTQHQYFIQGRALKWSSKGA